MNAKIERAVSTMRGFEGPWGFAGGWGLDLFLNRESRVHADVDIAILRGDQAHLRSRLDGRVEKVVSGRFVEWPPNERLALPVHEIHVTWPDARHLEFLLNEHDDLTREWVFRRDQRVRRPLALSFREGTAAPHLAPEIILLYKAKSPAAKDDGDFATVVPHLSGEQRTWLGEALALSAPGHPWLGSLHRGDRR